ncbi:PREDICTED: DC-STAMP domain-containing protein 1 [Condylura cristata]|uniref:DC-STAMP domain-containing protein 1 n=1 Tax=Condylura cristata TaxID=143302 RepID=UPI0003342F0B|nr:PREDICTED: DC-STAMP domain-containing protein 1 [Condylura cristata]
MKKDSTPTKTRRHHKRAKEQKLPHTTIQRFLSWVLPSPVKKFLCRQPGQFPISAVLLGAGIGGLLAIGLFQFLVNPMDIYEEQKIMVLYGLAGLGAVGWGTSPHIRCASLLLLPKMLGKEGRLFVLGYALAAIYKGPLSNMKYNLNKVVESLGCFVELQINNTRNVWRVSMSPLKAIFKDLLGSKESLRKETGNISNTFEELDTQVKSETGYTSSDTGALEKAGLRTEPLKYLSTQKMFELKTKLRCSYIVEKAVNCCRNWFDQKHSQCMQRIPVPFLNNLLCLPMQFKQLCGIARVMGIWCNKRLPVEGNFGQTYDSLNKSVRGLDGEFSANIDLKEEKQSGLVGTNVNWQNLGSEVRDYVRRQEAQLEWSLMLLRGLLSFTFLLVLKASFSYIDSYNRDIRFDNIYISTYFRQIDERRKRLGKQTLLPLRKVEEKTIIFPLKPAIQALEMRNMGTELLEALPVLLLLLLLCGLDWVLYTIFDTMRQQTFLKYSFRSSHKLEVKVGGDSMLSGLLRKTIGLLNTSSDTVIETTNAPCLPQPVSLESRAYVRVAVPMGVLLCLCLLQAFGYRLRRVIAAFYFPKREKKRILFLYNELLRKRAAFIQVRVAVIIKHAQQQKAPRPHLTRLCPFLRRWKRRHCAVCLAAQTPDSYVCPDCETMYCQSCWLNIRLRCPICKPPKNLSSVFSDSNDDATYAE